MTNKNKTWEEIRLEVYNLMDSFLVEAKDHRSVKRLNQDRHLFVENIEPLFNSYFQKRLKEILPEEKEIKKNRTTDEKRYPMGFNECLRIIKERAKL